MIKKSIHQIYRFLFFLSPWMILLGVYQYGFRPNFHMDRFQGPEFFDFFSITDLYIILLAAFFLFAFITNSLKLQKRPLPKTIILGVALILFAGYIQIQFQSVFEPVLNTPFKYFSANLLLPIIYAALAWFSLDSKDIKYLFHSYCLMIVFNSALSLTQYFFQPFPGDTTDFTGRLSWPFIDFISHKSASANWISFLSMPAFLLAAIQLFSSAITKKFHHSDITFILTILFAGPVIYLSQSYGSYAAIVIGFTIYLFQILRPKKFLIALIIIALTSTGIYFIQRQSPKVQILEGTIDYKYNNSVASRGDILKMNFFMIRHRPILGVGLNQYQSYFTQHQEEALGHTFQESHIPPHAHNFFLSFWTSLGIFGFLGVLILMLGALWQIRFKPQYPAFFALSAIMLHGLIDSYYWRPEIAYILWFTFVFSYLYQLKKPVANG